MSASIQKKKLLVQSNLYKDDFERELKIVKHQTNELLKNTLIIGGSLALTYILFRQVTSRRNKKRVFANTLDTKNIRDDVEEITTLERPSRFNSILSEIGTSLANEATAFLLSIAKEKLLELLTPKDTVADDADEDS